jgi:hypothetical protein
MKLLRDCGCDLTNDQKRKMFEVGVRWEELRRARSRSGRSVAVFDISLEREQYRAEYLDKLWEEFIPLKRASGEETEKDAMIMERYSATLLSRSTDIATLQLATAAYVTAMQHSSVLTVADSGHAGAAFLTPLFDRDSGLALSHLHTLLDRRRLPTRSSVIKVMQSSRKEEDYGNARMILAEACTEGGLKGEQGLDDLLRRRLDRLDSGKAEKDPLLAFIDWLIQDDRFTVGGPDVREWLDVAIKFWTTMNVPITAEGEGTAIIEAAAGRVLGRLTLRTCQLETSYNSSPSTRSAVKSTSTLSPGASPRLSHRPSPQLAMIASLAIDYAPHNVIVDRAHILLKTLCTTSPDFSLARSFYHALREKAPMNRPYPFQWHGNLLQSFVYLFKSALTPPPVGLLSSSPPAYFESNNTFDLNYEPNPRLALQLYTDWTADGLSFPLPLWSRLWAAVGKRSNEEELNRIIKDYEESGRQVNSDIIHSIVRYSANEGRVVKTLRIYNLLVAKSIVDRITLSIGTHEIMLNMLASSVRDRRSDAVNIIEGLLLSAKDESRPGPPLTVTVWNALIANHVYRSSLTSADLLAAGSVYNTLLASKIRPDSITFSLLIHGFLRASEGKEKGLESALRTFEVAMNAGMIIRSSQAIELMRALAERGRWEESKLISEKWWKGVVDELDHSPIKINSAEGNSERILREIERETLRRGGVLGREDSLEDQMEDMKQACYRIVKLEERSAAQKQVARS